MSVHDQPDVPTSLPCGMIMVLERTLISLAALLPYVLF